MRLVGELAYRLTSDQGNRRLAHDTKLFSFVSVVHVLMFRWTAFVSGVRTYVVSEFTLLFGLR
jgi:hypothetical protein